MAPFPAPESTFLQAAYRLHPRPTECPSAPQPGSTSLAVAGGITIQGHLAAGRFLWRASAQDAFLAARVDEWLALGEKLRAMALVACRDPALGVVKGEDAKLAGARAYEEMVALLAGGLEKALATETYLVSERGVNIADLAVACALARPFADCVDPNTRATKLINTTRWLQTVLAHPCMQGLLPADYAFCKDKVYDKVVVVAANQPKPKPAPSPTAPSATKPTAGLFAPERTRVKDALSGAVPVGSPILVCGWARTVRGSDADKLVFIELNDGSCLSNIQVVCMAGEAGLSKQDVQGVLDSGQVGASFQVRGTVVASPAKGQALEVKASSITVLGTIPDAKTYPLAKTKTGHSVEYLRTIAHLRPRTNLISCVARVRHACAMATHHFFDRLGFSYVHTPIITSADCEGAGEMFQVTTLLNAETRALPPVDKDNKVDYKQDFFGRPAFLTVSGQLNVECYATALSDVYTFGPTFRAENSNTTRHLAEFWMIEPEMCFAGLKEDMDLAEEFVKSVTREVMQRCAEDLAFFDERVEPGLLKRLENVLAAPFQRLKYTEAIEILERDFASGKKTFEVPPSWGIDLGSEHERYLTEEVFKKPVILTNYPAEIKAFYMRRSDEDPRTVEAMDVLVPKIGELVGGSARETRFELLHAKIAEHHLDMPFYEDLRRYGSVPHCGFGVGFERLVMFVTGVGNIRDVIPFPRFPGNADY